jgi:hypothetical protein
MKKEQKTIERVASFTPIGVTFETIDKLARTKNTDALALYMAYTAVAHWQKTYKPRATNSFMMKRLGWTEAKLAKARKVLKEFNLIKDIQENSEGKFGKTYTKVNHVVDSISDRTPVSPQERSSAGAKNGEQVLSTVIKVPSINKEVLSTVIKSENGFSQPKQKNNDSILSVESEDEDAEKEAVTDDVNDFDYIPSAKKKIKSVSPPADSDGAWLNKKIPLWKGVCSSWRDIYKIKTERTKLEKLYELHSEKEVDWIIKFGLPQTNPLPQKGSGATFFWKIFKPSELYRDWDKYVTEFKSKKTQFERQKNRVSWI